jgi:hypothetical protein
MLKISVELIPPDDRECEIIATAHISNVATTEDNYGKYTAVFYNENGRMVYGGTNITHFREDDVWTLIKLALQETQHEDG